MCVNLQAQTIWMHNCLLSMLLLLVLTFHQAYNHAELPFFLLLPAGSMPVQPYISTANCHVVADHKASVKSQWLFSNDRFTPATILSLLHYILPWIDWFECVVPL